MKKFNVFYRIKNQVVNKNDLTWDEVNDFLESLGKEDDSELRVIQVEDREEEEER